MGLPQIKERVSCLSGELKAAREAQGECRTARDNQKRLLDIAEQAVERADARVTELEAERADLAEQARAAVLETGEPPPLASEDPAHNVPVEIVGDSARNPDGSPFIAGATGQGANPFLSNYDTMLENAENRVNGAFDRATQ